MSSILPGSAGSLRRHFPSFSDLEGPKRARFVSIKKGTSESSWASSEASVLRHVAPKLAEELEARAARAALSGQPCLLCYLEAHVNAEERFAILKLLGLARTQTVFLGKPSLCWLYSASEAFQLLSLQASIPWLINVLINVPIIESIQRLMVPRVCIVTCIPCRALPPTQFPG